MSNSTEYRHTKDNETGSVDRAPRILVVDDVMDNREVLTRRLVKRGFEVEEASGGLEALEKIEQSEFDLVLLDIMMPDLNGTEVLMRVRQTYSPRELPIVMVTAKSQSEDVVACLDEGANDYVTKPVDFAIALARINTQIEQKLASDAINNSAEHFEKEAVRLDRLAEESSVQLEKTSEELKRETELRKQSEQELQFLAFHDGLTGLLNRTAFENALNAAIEESKDSNSHISLLFVDLDGFKKINDQYGHKCGDQVLKAAADRVKALLGEETSVARLGGDEFCAILVDQQDAVAMGEKLLSSLREPFILDDFSCEIGASCGVAKTDTCMEDLDELVKAADLAMYHGKTAGKGRVVLFEPFMMERKNERRELENDLRVAVKNGDFEVFFQPLIDTKTNEISCFEALVRWTHPSRGMISPDVFIPIAEETGLIVQIGEWVLRQACQEAMTWPDDISVAVNLSPVQFKTPALLPAIINTLAKTQLAPERLELEITESVLFEAEEANSVIVNNIRDLGVKISLDDFGTGYSSLSYLQSFAFDKIKIDKCFVQEFADNSDNSFIVQAILNLGNGLGVQTTAEGVESPSQLQFVTENGCTQAQGYLFSRPLSASDAAKYIATSDERGRNAA